MARLQRKKTPSKVKKEKNGNAQVAQADVDADGSSNGAAALTATVRDIKKKKQAGSKKIQVAAKAGLGKKEPNIFSKSAQFLREVKVELKKVAWPSRKQTTGSTAVVIVLVMIIALFLWVVDMGLSSLIQLVVK